MQAEADTPIEIVDMTKLTPEERELLIDGIRERRLKPVKVYEELSLMQAQAKKEALEVQWAKMLEMFDKELVRADKAMEKLEDRARKIRAMEMEIEQL